MEPSRDSFRFKVLHVYKGSLRKGQVIDVQSSWGFSPRACSGMIPTPPPQPGMYGVVAYRGTPELSFVPEDVLAKMFEARLIKSARQHRQP